MMNIDKEYEKAKKNYITLMQIIDEYKNDDAASSKGLLYFLEGVVPELAITKYGKRLGMEALKEFFCNEVLQMHHGSRSFCEYENFFMKGNSDGYVFDVQYLNAYMGDMALNEYGIPKLLLQRLWRVAHEMLKGYFSYDKYRDEEKSKGEVGKRTSLKSDRYCSFVMAVGLYEIFVMRYLHGVSFVGLLELVKYLCSVEESITVALHRQEKMKAEEVLQDIEKEIETMNKQIRKMMKEVQRATEYFHHIKYLAAFSMVVMLVEYNNLNWNIRLKRVSSSENTADFEAIWPEEFKYIYMSDVRLNKGKIYTQLYCEFKDVVEQNVIIQKLYGKSAMARKSVLNEIKEYFYAIKKGTYMDTDGNEAEDFAKVVMRIAMKCIETK